ncbi:FRG domain-containing protein [Kocuria rhizophila]|uniref:FRG domain-containing protein n=1 Tax=Kocuria rhizophila TaxID=72000 RepID=UPI001EF42C15|nr:FRG domain-containing protein [Kocuria rhizophila]MCG7424181.1 FRG domain-containing protein [Kocuria rhizophila]MCT1456451.1 FRG domain-containing protein [Kocuria rhizophila]MCT1879268.1 FRG domain-containing protein [Kocuria rhizophila]MCT2249085.1 FRG domain-containing protein [Kocuria rhizophila]
MLTWKPPSNNAAQAAREIVSAATWFHSTFANEVWLWRGQADSRFGVEPGMHTRVLNSSLSHNESTVAKATQHLINTSRRAGLDKSGTFTLPDLALLATLQHHGAATPLLDVTTDPLIALWMAVNATPENPAGLDNTTGRLFGILRPSEDRWLDPLDSRKYFRSNTKDITSTLKDSYFWYRAPDVTERLRIQRGSFIIGSLNQQSPRSDTSIPFELGNAWSESAEGNYVERRIGKRGRAANNFKRRSEVFSFTITGSVKRELRKLLIDRSGLSVRTVYPTPWHKPFIEQFSETYGRGRRLELDVT